MSKVKKSDIAKSDSLYDLILRDNERKALDNISYQNKPGKNNVIVTESRLVGVEPGLHHETHESGGKDAIKLDDLATPNDNIDLNTGIAAHGLCPKLDNDNTHYLDGEGNWTAPASVDEKVKVTANDTTPDYLYNKLASGNAIVITETNDGGDEDATIAAKYDDSTIGIDGANQLEVKDDGVTAVKVNADVAGNGIVQGATGALDLNPDNTTLETNADAIRIKDDGVTATKINPDVAGDALVQNGATGALDVNPDGATLETNADTIRVKDNGIVAAKIGADVNYSAISGNDIATNVTGAELETLSDGSNADALHTHAGGADEKVKVSVDDTTPDYLYNKLVAGDAITLTETNPGGNEDVTVTVDYDNTTISLTGGGNLEVKDDGVIATKINADVAGTGLSQGAGGALDVSATYTTISGNDAATNVTGAELEELTDGSDTILHTHSGLTPGLHGASHTDGTDNIAVDGSTIEINANALQVKDDGINATKLNADTAGDGIVQNAITGALDINPDNSTIEINTDILRVKDDGITAAKLNTDTAGNGLIPNAVTGALDINPDNSTIEINTDILRVKDDGIVAAKIGADVAGDGIVQGATGALDLNPDNTTLETNADAIRIKDDGVDKTKINADIAGTGLSQAFGGELDVSATYTTISNNDGATDVTGAELETLSDTSYADSLHKHKNTTYTNVLTVHPTASEADYQTLAAAVAAASALVWQEILLLPGEHEISSSVTLPTKTHLRGVSRDACVIKTTGAAAIQPMIVPVVNCMISNLTLLGQWNTYNDYGIQPAALVTDWKIDNVFFDSLYYGIYINQTNHRSSVNNCQFETTANPIYCNGTLMMFQGGVHNCYALRAAGSNNAFYVKRGKGKFTNCHADGAWNIGFYSHGADTLMTLQACTADGCADGFVTANSTAKLHLIGCEALNITSEAVKTYATGNRIYLAGGVYDETQFTDAGTGFPVTKAITGGFFNLDTEVFDIDRTPV